MGVRRCEAVHDEMEVVPMGSRIVGRERKGEEKAHPRLIRVRGERIGAGDAEGDCPVVVRDGTFDQVIPTGIVGVADSAVADGIARKRVVAGVAVDGVLPAGALGADTLEPPDLLDQLVVEVVLQDAA